MIVETKNASLDTMSVTIKALHVSGKQMTLAVFRQLPVISAFDSEGGLELLDFWGLVRYPIKDEACLWAVASSEGILYRCSAEIGPWNVDRAERLYQRCKTEHTLFKLWERWAIYDLTPTGPEKICPSENRINPRCFDYKIGNNRYEKELCEAEQRLHYLRIKESSVKILEKLPQLFIAV